MLQVNCTVFSSRNLGYFH